MSDADFVQSAQEEESSLDQTTKGIDREPSRFRTFRPGLVRVQRNLRDSRQSGTTRQDLKSTKDHANVANFTPFAKFTRKYSEIGVIRWKERRFQNQRDLELVWQREFRTIRAGYCIPADSV